MDVALVARLAEVPLDDFKALNPSANKPVILAAGKPYILLPWDNAEVFQNNLDGFAGARLASWTVWVVPQTMSVAAASKRSGMGEQQLRELNSIPPRMLIRAGSSLLVPRAAKLDQDVGTKVADNGQLSLTPEIVLLRKLIKAGKKDTVASIASRYKTTPANVAQKLVAGSAAKLIAGVNLPMLFRSVCYRDEPLDALVARALTGGTQGVMQVAITAPQNQNRRIHDQNHNDHQQ
jgi:membrane-bound lytic murein transglycosylase D